MAELTTLARPYAKAVFEYALGANALDAWAVALGTAAAVVQQPRVAQLLSAPRASAADKAAAIIALCGDALDEAGRNFVRLLAENKRLPLLPQVHELFLALKANQERVVELTVTSAFEIEPAQATKLADIMGKKLKRTVRVSTTVDQSLIGGVVVRTDDLVIDGSIRGSLAKLSEAMNS
jgi:F-type H+-transporting ATPase subunit delta